MLEERKVSHKDLLRSREESKEQEPNTVMGVRLNDGVKPLNFLGYVVL